MTLTEICVSGEMWYERERVNVVMSLSIGVVEKGKGKREKGKGKRES